MVVPLTVISLPGRGEVDARCMTLVTSSVSMPFASAKLASKIT